MAFGQMHPVVTSEILIKDSLKVVLQLLADLAYLFSLVSMERCHFFPFTQDDDFESTITDFYITCKSVGKTIESDVHNLLIYLFYLLNFITGIKYRIQNYKSRPPGGPK